MYRDFVCFFLETETALPEKGKGSAKTHATGGLRFVAHSFYIVQFHQ